MKDRNFSWLYSHNTRIIKAQGAGKIRTHLMSHATRNLRAVSPTECKHRQTEIEKSVFSLHCSRRKNRKQSKKKSEKWNRLRKFIFISIATDFCPVWISVLNFTYFTTETVILKKKFKPKNTKTFRFLHSVA